jgi:hypothetical protein
MESNSPNDVRVKASICSPNILLRILAHFDTGILEDMECLVAFGKASPLFRHLSRSRTLRCLSLYSTPGGIHPYAAKYRCREFHDVASKYPEDVLCVKVLDLDFFGDVSDGWNELPDVLVALSNVHTITIRCLSEKAPSKILRALNSVIRRPKFRSITVHGSTVKDAIARLDLYTALISGVGVGRAKELEILDDCVTTFSRQPTPQTTSEIFSSPLFSSITLAVSNAHDGDNSINWHLGLLTQEHLFATSIRALHSLSIHLCQRISYAELNRVLHLTRTSLKHLSLHWMTGERRTYVYVLSFANFVLLGWTGFIEYTSKLTLDHLHSIRCTWSEDEIDYLGYDNENYNTQEISKLLDSITADNTLQQIIFDVHLIPESGLNSKWRLFVQSFSWHDLRDLCFASFISNVPLKIMVSCVGIHPDEVRSAQSLFEGHLRKEFADHDEHGILSCQVICYPEFEGDDLMRKEKITRLLKESDRF